MDQGEPGQDLRATSWWHIADPAPVGASRQQAPYRIYRFGEEGELEVEQGVEETEMAGAIARRARTVQLVTEGCWKVEQGRASISFDGESWIAVEILGPGRLRIGEEELVTAPRDGQLTGMASGRRSD